jgi:uncharacterized membrane protein
VTAVRGQAVDATTTKPPKLPAFLHGIALGGLVDGILLHQILQWHHMVSNTSGHPTNTVAGLEANTVGDGFFHVLTWLVLVAAMSLTVRAWQRRELAPPWRAHFGLMLAGWGVFNVVEGLIDHQVLGIHHVRDDLGGPIGWDIGFLIFGALLIVGGLALHRSGERIAQQHSAKQVARASA